MPLRCSCAAACLASRARVLRRATAKFDDVSARHDKAETVRRHAEQRATAVTGEITVLEETRRLTHFSALRPGACVNLERSLRFGGKVGGHFVTGHIDALGTVEVFEPRGKDYYLRIRIPVSFAKYIVHKGSIAIDGISLTLAEVTADTLAVWLIPHTLTVTNLREKRAGDPVNLEFDLLGKHVEKLLLTRSA